ncbi:MAG: ribosome silencing factor [Candidatus Hydrogenedentes bacterium]|nr:ribosome silencing factor [Candidatus Hydrogenedentota bacterium]
MAELAAQHKALDLRGYHVEGLTLLADSFLLCSASSDPQLRAICRAVKDGMAEIGVRPLRSDGKPAEGWLVLDYGTIIFHVFRKEKREFYDLDGLWADAPEIDLGVEA